MSNNNSNKKYVGNGKKVGDYDLVNFSINITKSESDIYEYKGQKFLKMSMGGNRDGANEYGQTHKIWIDEYKPANSTAGDANNGSDKSTPLAKVGDGLPF